MTGRQRSRGRFDSSAQQIAATTFGHAFSNTGQEAGSITNITFSPGQLASTVVYRVLTLPASSALNPFGTKANLVYSFPDVGPEQVDVDTITYRLFGDVRGTAAGRPSTCRWIDTASSSRTTSFRQRRPAALGNFVSTVRGPSAVLPVCTNTVTSGTCNQVNELTPVGYPAYSLYPYLNAGSTRTSGIDVDLRSQFELVILAN